MEREVTAGSVSASSAASSSMGSTSAAAGRNRLTCAGEGHGICAEMHHGSSEGEGKLLQGGVPDAVLGLERAAGVQVCLLITMSSHSACMCAAYISLHTVSVCVSMVRLSACICVCSGARMGSQGLRLQVRSPFVVTVIGDALVCTHTSKVVTLMRHTLCDRHAVSVVSMQECLLYLFASLYMACRCKAVCYVCELLLLKHLAMQAAGGDGQRHSVSATPLLALGR